nr:unnamed protein product [Digitaria exilis]
MAAEQDDKDSAKAEWWVTPFVEASDLGGRRSWQGNDEDKIRMSDVTLATKQQKLAGWLTKSSPLPASYDATSSLDRVDIAPFDRGCLPAPSLRVLAPSGYAKAPPLLMFFGTLKRHKGRIPNSGPLTTRAKSFWAEPTTLGDAQGFGRRSISGSAPRGAHSDMRGAGEDVVFRDMFDAGLRFPLDPVIVVILDHFKIRLHQLTPNAFVRLSLYLWISKTTGIPASAKGFAFTHRVHKQPRSVALARKDGSEVRREGHFGCLNFIYHADVSRPLPLEWSDDWWTSWFYCTIEPEGSKLANGDLGKLAKPFEVTPFTTESLNDIPIPDFRQCFRVTKALLEGVEAEDRANRILGRETHKENKESRKLLGSQRRNRVFKFFKKVAPPRAALWEAEADTGRGHGGRGGRRKGPKRQKIEWFRSIDEDEGPLVAEPPLIIVPLQVCAPPAAVDKDLLVVVAAKEHVGPVKASDPFDIVRPRLRSRKSTKVILSWRRRIWCLRPLEVVLAKAPLLIRLVKPARRAIEEGEKEETSSGFFVATGDPAEVVRPGCPDDTKVIGGKAKGVLQFQNGGHEHEFLEEASRLLCFPFMEEELCQTGTRSFLKNVENLALKTFYVENLHPYNKSSDCGKVLKLEAENKIMAEELKRECEHWDMLEQAISVAKSDYANGKKKLEEATVDLEVERRLQPQLEMMEKEKDLLKQTLEGRDKDLEELRRDFEHY